MTPTAIFGCFVPPSAGFLFYESRRSRISAVIGGLMFDKNL